LFDAPNTDPRESYTLATLILHIFSFAINEHLEFQQSEAGTKAMFACERRSRYNCSVAAAAPMPTGPFFDEN
jgi:hypothetical protein